MSSVSEKSLERPSYDALQVNGFRSHWKKIAVPSGILLIASLAVTGVVVGLYFSQPQLLAGHAACYLFIASGAPGAAAIVIFAVGSAYLCLRKENELVIEREPEQDSLESDSEIEDSEHSHKEKNVSQRDDEEEEEASFSISERGEPEEFETSGKSIEEDRPGILLHMEGDVESDQPSKIQAEISSSDIKKTEKEEEVEDKETSHSSQIGETFHTQKEVFEKVFDPVFDSLRSFVSALVTADYYADKNLKFNGKHPYTLQATLDTLNGKLEEFREFLKDKTQDTEFLLKGCLSHILEPETGNNVLRQLIVAHNYQNAEKGAKLQKHINKIKSSRDLTNIKELFAAYRSDSDISELLGNFKEILKKKFTLDDRFIEKIVKQIIDSLVEEVNTEDEELLRRMALVATAAPLYSKPNREIAQIPGKDERHFINSLNFLISYLFDQAYSNKKDEIDALAQEIIQYALLKASNPDTIDEEMKLQVKRLLKILPRALTGMEIYYSSSKDEAPGEMNKHFLDVESTDSQNEDSELNKLQAQLFDIQLQINANRKNSDHPCPVALLVLKNSEYEDNKYLENPIVAYCYGIKNSSTEDAKNKAIKHFGELQNTVPKDAVAKIAKLSEDRDFTIVAVPCGKKDSPLSLIKGLEGHGGRIRMAVSVGNSLLTFLSTALPSLMSPINKMMQIPGLSADELKVHRERMLTLLPIVAYPIVDALISDSHAFRKLFQRLFAEHKNEILEELQAISKTEHLSWVTLRDMFLGTEQEDGKKRGIPRLTELLENTYKKPKK